MPPRYWLGLFRSKNSRARGLAAYEPGPPYTCARCAVSPPYQARHTSMSANGSANWIGGQGVFPDVGSGMTVSFEGVGLGGEGEMPLPQSTSGEDPVAERVHPVVGHLQRLLDTAQGSLVIPAVAADLLDQRFTGGVDEELVRGEDARDGADPVHHVVLRRRRGELVPLRLGRERGGGGVDGDELRAYRADVGNVVEPAPQAFGVLRVGELLAG